VSKKPESHEEELAAIMNALAESVAEASDDDILEEARARGEDPTQIARHTKDVLLNAVKRYRKQRLHEAQQQYEVHVASMQTKTYQLPESPTERRQLLDLTLSRQSAVRFVFTALHREFSSLSDNDVESFLRQLQELGFLDALTPPEGSEK
jgi:hypothetical protein